MDKKDDRVLGMKLVRDDITAEVRTRVRLSSLLGNFELRMRSSISTELP